MRLIELQSSNSSASQLELFEPSGHPGEDPEYYRRQLITYLGNKRRLLNSIGEAARTVAAALDKPKLRILDGFAGSGVVSRLFKSRASELVANDLESYARVVANCYLANRSDVDLDEVSNLVDTLNHTVDTGRPGEPGFIERMYAPEDDNDIKPGERAFYTRDNARRLDQFRQLIGDQESTFFDLLMGPLLSAASVHANTSGVFKGFYKDKATGCGRFGGSGSNALERIIGQIRVQAPLLSKYECNVEVHQCDTNDLVRRVGNFDLAYFDPPYNQHPYGSNYFMLNLLVNYIEPRDVSKVSGISTGWNRSAYNQRQTAFDSLTALIQDVDARYILLSFNDDGFVQPDRLRTLLSAIGPTNEVQHRHNTFRGSRNLHARNRYVTEHLFLVRKV